MKKRIGIVRETKNEWERRVPLVPADVKKLIESSDVEVLIQPSGKRIFSDQEYQMAGAMVIDDLSSCDLILGIKEVQINDIIPGKTYCFFSHTIKGQSYNMTLLQRMLNLRCTLIDYERMVDEENRRLIYFSYHAGVAGMIESLWALGRRLETEDISSPFKSLKQTLSYADQKEAELAFVELGEAIKTKGLPTSITPLIIGVTGYGNVSRGAQHMLDLLPVEEVSAEALLKLQDKSKDQQNKIYKVVFKEKDMYVPVSESAMFDLQEYYDHPDRYRSIFDKYIPRLGILVNATFWDTTYPKHVTKESLKRLFQGNRVPNLRVIGDISCDVEGGVEGTLKVTDPGNPVFVYNPASNSFVDGFDGPGIVIMAVDNLPSELPKDASIYFSSVLKNLLPPIIKVDFSDEFNKLALSTSQKKAVITYNGQLADDYKYLKKYL
jgi:alanine dehydrogenase